MLLPSVQQSIDRRIAEGRERARPFYEAHPDRAPDWFKSEPRVTHLVRRPRPALPPTTAAATFSTPPIIQPAKTMTEALSITTSAATIEATAKAAGPFFFSALSQLLGSASLGEVSVLSLQHNGITHSILATIVSPFLNGFSAVKDMPRSVMISSQPGNDQHLEKLTAATRRALIDRDPVSANRAIRGLGATDGFSTSVIGV